MLLIKILKHFVKGKEFEFRPALAEFEFKPALAEFEFRPALAEFEFRPALAEFEFRPALAEFDPLCSGICAVPCRRTNSWRDIILLAVACHKRFTRAPADTRCP